MTNEELLTMLQRVSHLSSHCHGHNKKGHKHDCGHHHRHDHEHGCGCHEHDHEHKEGCGNHEHAQGHKHTHGRISCNNPASYHGQNRVLAALLLKDGASQKDLAYLLGIRPQSLGQAIAKLEATGYVTRQQSPEDGRVMNVFITESGIKRAQEAAERRKTEASDLFDILSDEEKDQFASILDKLAAKLDEEEALRKKHCHQHHHAGECGDHHHQHEHHHAHQE